MEFRSVIADTGSIGGSSSHEFHVLAESGEDQIAFSDSSDYAANVEKAETLISETPRPAPAASMEKVATAVNEGRFRPAEKIHQPWVEHNENQVLGGLGYLDGLAEPVGRDGWLAGTTTLSQADITAVVAFSCIEVVRPTLGIADKFPHLAKFAARCEELEIFLAAPIPDSLPS